MSNSTTLLDEDFDHELWAAACREADSRDDLYVTPEDVLAEWDAEDSFDGYSQKSYDLYDQFAYGD